MKRESLRLTPLFSSVINVWGWQAKQTLVLGHHDTILSLDPEGGPTVLQGKTAAGLTQ